MGSEIVGPETTRDASRTALAVRGARKSFAGTQALLDFGFELRQGEVHALVGGNGSGKSTLIKMLAGIYEADAGELETAAQGVGALADQSPSSAAAQGLRFVHQDPGIFPILSVAENLAIGSGFPVGPTGRIRWRRCRANARETLARFHVDIDPSAQAASLSPPQRAMLAIARALQTIDEDSRGILVLDEPTASLPPEEATMLLSLVRRLADAGHTVLLVTHRLDEVKRAADRVSGVRDGRCVGTIDAGSMTEEDIVELILGHKLESAAPVHTQREEAEPVLQVSGLRGGPVRGVDFAVHPGEVVGIAGLVGSGRSELLEMIFGVRERDGGEIRLGDKTIGRPTARMMRRLGVAFVPEDRAAEGVFPDFTIVENVTAGAVDGRFYVNERKVRRAVERDIAAFHVKTSSPHARIETLSGGNQQKVVLARWLRSDVRLILLDEPTQGIDVGAREEIFALVNEAIRGGAGAILVSSEFEELTRLSHRILVLANGRIAAEFETAASTHEILQSVLEHARSETT
jgi:ribose transport system ATP-binding protein